jgi:hypothetical protein
VQFVSALRSLIAKCEYDEHFIGELLRDRFVAGCSSDKIREKLLLEPDTLTLDQALVIANNFERVAIESKNVAGDVRADSGSVMRVSMKGRSTSPGKVRGACFACGRAGHRKGDPKCPALGKTCNLCHGANHFANCCRKKQVDRGKSQEPNKSKQQRPPAKAPQADTVVGVVDACVSVGAVQSLGESVAVNCVVNGCSLCLVCDTGARVSILNSTTVDKLQLHVCKPTSEFVLKA